MLTSATAKRQVFDHVRRALGQFSQSDKARQQSHYDTVTAGATPRPIVDGTLLERFCDKHTAVHGTVQCVASLSAVPGAVEDYLQRHDLPTEMVMGNTDFLCGIDWPDTWSIARRTACKTDVVAVTDAVCAIAETGSMVIANSPKVSSTHLYLPENHIVIMDVGQLVRHLEEALELASQHQPNHSRGIHLITGPSKTADVEQTIQYGAHGPRRLHAIFIDTRTAH